MKENKEKTFELLNLRRRREIECFKVVNRGQLWYASLTKKQVEELNKWYKQWLEITKTKVVPQRPSWLGQ